MILCVNLKVKLRKFYNSGISFSDIRISPHAVDRFISRVSKNVSISKAEIYKLIKQYIKPDYFIKKEKHYKTFETVFLFYGLFNNKKFTIIIDDTGTVRTVYTKY